PRASASQISTARAPRTRAAHTTMPTWVRAVATAGRLLDPGRRQLAGPAVRDGEAPVLAERLRRDAHAGPRLPSLVLVSVDARGHALHVVGIVAFANQLRDRLVLFHVALHDRVEQLVDRE